MSPALVQTLPYALAVLPLALAGILSAVWWDALARPWLFLATGSLALYGFLTLVVFAVIFIGPGFRGYFLEVPTQSNERSSSLDPFTTTTAIALVAFLIIGTAILYALRQWLSKP